MSTGKGRIRTSVEEGKIQKSTGKCRIQESIGDGVSGRVPKMWDPGEYWEGRNPGEYRKR